MRFKRGKSKITNAIKKIMAEENGTGYVLIRFLFFILSIYYSGVVKIREMLYRKGLLPSKRLPCMVISVGNLSSGGTGKTPMVIFIAQFLKKLGYNTVVISRGYKGGSEKKGGIVSDGRNILMGPEPAGDEPFMMAMMQEQIPVLVGKNRYKTGLIAVKRFAPEIILLDDAFQHLQLKRDIDIVLLDSLRPLGNGYVLPRGFLREPVSALRRGQVFIFTRSDKGFCRKKSQAAVLSNLLYRQPVFKTFYTSYFSRISWKKRPGDNNVAPRHEEQMKSIENLRVFAFSGLADNADFRRTLMEYHFILKGFAEFPDHYVYSDKDLDAISNEAIHSKAEAIVTTEKDYARIFHKINWPLDLIVIGIKISFGEDEDHFNAFMKDSLETFREKRI